VLAANETFGRIHRDGANGVLAEVLRDFENEALAVVLSLERVQDGRQVIVELDVHNGANHLTDLADNIAHTVYPCFACGEAARHFPSSCLRRCGPRGLPYLRGVAAPLSSLAWRCSPLDERLRFLALSQ